MDVKTSASRLTDQTLAEQLKITDRDIEERKRLTGFTDDDVRELMSCKIYIQENLDEIVDEFYTFQRQVAEIQLIIGDAETFRRLYSSMKRYVLELFEGYYDREYVNRRLRIGRVHKSIGVSPKLYISSLARMETILQNRLSQMEGSTMEVILNRSAALRKLLMLDVQFVFDTYINSLMSEVLTAKGQVERYAETLEAEVAERTRQLENLSKIDSLTQLENQRSFYERLRHELAVAQRSKTYLSLMYFDLNNFKKLNDTQGHRTGDKLLAYVGTVLRETARISDFCCRYGGDEFCIIMPHTDCTAAQIVSERLLERFDEGETCRVSLSIGVKVIGCETYPDIDEFVRGADEVMYEAKTISRKENGHTIRISPPLSEREA